MVDKIGQTLKSIEAELDPDRDEHGLFRVRIRAVFDDITSNKTFAKHLVIYFNEENLARAREGQLPPKGYRVGHVYGWPK